MVMSWLTEARLQLQNRKVTELKLSSDDFWFGMAVAMAKTILILPSLLRCFSGSCLCADFGMCSHRMWLGWRCARVNC